MAASSFSSVPFDPDLLTGVLGVHARSNLRTVLLAATVIAATLVVFQSRWNAQGLDDAWITYRYARNIDAGNGWTYNVGERVQGSSTPFYTLWLAAWGACGLAIPWVSAVTCCLATCGTTLLIFLFLRKCQPAAVGLLAVALVLASPFLRIAPSGMETALYVFLCIAALFCAGSGRWHAGFALAGLAMFTRLDGASVLAAVGAWYLLEQRRLPLKESIAPLALNLGWFAFAYFYFGRALPNSFYAKQFHSGHTHFARWMIGALLDLSPGWWILALTGAGFILINRRARALAPLLIWAIGYVAAYSLSQLDFYGWYVAPMVVVVCLLAAVGVGALAGITREPTTRISSRVMHAVMGAGLATIAIIPVFTDTRRMDARYASPVLERARYDGAMFARRVVPRDAVIAAAGIGQVGWCTDNPVLDAGGLVSPQTLADRPAPWFWHALDDVAEHERPQFIFDAVDAHLGWPPGVTRNYRPVANFPHDNDRFTPFVLWERSSR